MKELKLHNEEVTGDSKFSTQFDLITIHHMLYYINTSEERQNLFRHLIHCLEDKGILAILQMAMQHGVNIWIQQII